MDIRENDSRHGANRTASWSVSALCDSSDTKAVVLDAPWLDLGGHQRFCGEVETVQVEYDTSLVQSVLSSPGQGRVLVVAGLGRRSHALVDGSLASLAVRTGWAGVVVDGAVRDLETLAQLPIGLVACRVHARRGTGGDPGLRGRRVQVAGTKISPGSWIYADRDGVVTAKGRLHP